MKGGDIIPYCRRMAVPKAHWSACLTNVGDSFSYKKKIQKYIDNIEDNVREPKGLLLFGEYSAGKSGLASIILKAAALKGIIGFWVVVRDLPEQVIKNVIFDDEYTVWERARMVPILVVDELLIRKEVRYTEQAVEVLIRHRVDEKLCTIITTNHTPQAIQKSYPALFAVLQEAVVPLKVSGMNFRDRKLSI
jgi:DNA replication protein DnaC